LVFEIIKEVEVESVLKESSIEITYIEIGK